MSRQNQFALGAALGTACAVAALTVAAPAIAQSNVVTMNTVQIFGTIDPAKVNDYTEYMAAVNLYDGLVTVDESGNILPQLAESWEANDDSSVFTFHLNPDAVFQDGSPVTADDVVYTVERLLSINQGPAFLFEGILEPGNIEAVDDHTVVFTLTDTFSPFLATMPAVFIVNADLVRENEGDDQAQEYLATNVASAGPYTLESWERGSRMTLVRSDNYYGGWHEGAIDEIRWIVTNDEATVRSLAASGELTMTSQYQATETYDAILAMDGYYIAEEGSAVAFYYKLNTQIPPTDDVHIRRAIACATDYDLIRDVILPGAVLSPPLPSIFADFHLSDAPAPTYDLDCARDEIAQSAYADADSIPIVHAYVAGTAFEEEIALLFQSTMEELGFDVTLQPEPWNRLTELAGEIETTPNLSQVFFGPTYPSPDSMFYTQYHSNAAGTWASMEWVLSDEVDGLIDAARATADVDEQAEIYRELQALLIEIQPDAFLLTQLVRHGMSDCLTGFRTIPMQSFDYDMYRYTWTCDANG
jgi:peptide/nickel transport system substrate-binding protein